MAVKSVALVPFYPRMGQTAENLDRILQICRQIFQKSKVDAVLFPELALSGYMLEDLTNHSALSLEDHRLREFEKLSLQGEITLGTVLKEDHEIYNAALTFQAGKLIQVQKKIYLPTYGMFDEARFFQGGDRLQNFQGILGKTAVLICEDAWHNVLPYILAVEKVRVVYVLSNSPIRQTLQDAGQVNSSAEFWQKMLSVYAVCNNQIFVYINRSGTEDGVSFGGEAFVAMPNGSILEPQSLEGVFWAEIDGSVLEHSFHEGGSFLNENHLLNEFLLQKALQQRMGRL